MARYSKKKKAKKINFLFLFALILISAITLTNNLNSLKDVTKYLASVTQVFLSITPQTPTISSISPFSVANNQVVDIVLFGSDFGSGYTPMVLELYKDNEVISASDLVINDDLNQVNARVDLSNVTPGLWSIRASNLLNNQRFSSTLINSFSITDQAVIARNSGGGAVGAFLSNLNFPITPPVAKITQNIVKAVEIPTNKVIQPKVNKILAVAPNNNNIKPTISPKPIIKKIVPPKPFKNTAKKTSHQTRIYNYQAFAESIFNQGKKVYGDLIKLSTFLKNETLYKLLSY